MYSVQGCSCYCDCHPMEACHDDASCLGVLPSTETVDFISLIIFYKQTVSLTTNGGPP